MLWIVMDTKTLAFFVFVLVFGGYLDLCILFFFCSLVSHWRLLFFSRWHGSAFIFLSMETKCTRSSSSPLEKWVTGWLWCPHCCFPLWCCIHFCQMSGIVIVIDGVSVLCIHRSWWWKLCGSVYNFTLSRTVQQPLLVWMYQGDSE